MCFCLLFNDFTMVFDTVREHRVAYIFFGASPKRSQSDNQQEFSNQWVLLEQGHGLQFPPTKACHLPSFKGDP